MSSIVMRGTARPLSLVLGIASIIVLLRGHDAPGGGFIGGLLAVSACAFLLIAFGPVETRRMLRIDARTLIATGLAALTCAALLPMALGGAMLEAQWWFAILGTVKVGTVLLFDIGVYLVVCGASLLVLFTLAGE